MSTGELITEPERNPELFSPMLVARLDHYVDSVNRRPDWKWQRAYRILHKGDMQPSRKLDGVSGCMTIRTILQFMRSVPQVVNYHDSRVLFERFPYLYQAYEIWTDRRAKSRWAMEANLLTRRDFHEIAVNLRVPIQVVEMYADVFFDVRKRLKNVGYIRDQVIQPACYSQHGEIREFDYLWKLYAYFYGHFVLDAVISSVTNPVYCGLPSTVEQVFKDDVNGGSALQASIASKSLARNDETRLQIIKMHAQYLALKTDKDGETVQNSLMSAIYSLVQSMPLRFGSSARNEEFEKRPYLKASYEIAPQQELAAALAGETIATVPETPLTFEQLIEENLASDPTKRR